MIRNKKELSFYLKADMMMNRGYFKKNLLQKIYEIWIPDKVIQYLHAMRCFAYYAPLSSRRGMKKYLYLLPMLYYKRKFVLLGNKLGFSIGKDCFGYGLVIHHSGTIVIGSNNTIGNYALLNTSTCITKNGSQIGDGFFLGSGANIIKKISLGNDTWIGANSVVNQSFPDGGVLVAGIPGKIIKENVGSWYNTLYGECWKERYLKVEGLKKKMFS